MIAIAYFDDRLRGALRSWLYVRPVATPSVPRGRSIFEQRAGAASALSSRSIGPQLRPRSARGPFIDRRPLRLGARGLLLPFLYALVSTDTCPFEEVRRMIETPDLGFEGPG